VACYELGIDWFGSELDKMNFDEGQERYIQDTKQMLFEF